MPEKLKIMVLDDEPEITKGLKRMLFKEGYEVIEVNDPMKVEEYLLYTNLSLLVTDFNMPGLDGLGVLDIVKKTKPELPVIFLTGVLDLETAVEATRSGAAEYLTKPVNTQKLVAAVKKHVLVDEAIPEDVAELIKKQKVLDEDDEAADPDKIVLEDEIISTETIPKGFVELRFEDILPGQMISFALYIQIFNKRTKRFSLRKVCQENTVFTTGLRNILAKRNLASAYIHEKDYRAYLEYITALKSSPHFNIERVTNQKKLVLYGKAVEAVTEILNKPVENKSITSAIGLVDHMFQTMVDDPVTYNDLFKLFQRDDTIFSHSANVCLLSVSFGIYLGLDPKRVKVLGLGTLFHDLGMNRVDRKILEKRRPLTEPEWREIKLHPERGYAILKSSVIVPLSSLKIVLEHHEKDDGTGYPRGIAGEKINMMAKICRLVDKFDSMTTDKPYRKGFLAPEALKRIYWEESDETMKKVVLKFIQFLGGQ
ncbi:MAG: response regulator [Proteobacteria bacterium]|nr:response regulator [Pseudomonadota bacterium]